MRTRDNESFYFLLMQRINIEMKMHFQVTQERYEVRQKLYRLKMQVDPVPHTQIKHNA